MIIGTKTSAWSSATRRSHMRSASCSKVTTRQSWLNVHDQASSFTSHGHQEGRASLVRPQTPLRNYLRYIPSLDCRDIDLEVFHSYLFFIFNFLSTFFSSTLPTPHIFIITFHGNDNQRSCCTFCSFPNKPFEKHQKLPDVALFLLIVLPHP